MVVSHSPLGLHPLGPQGPLLGYHLHRFKISRGMQVHLLEYLSPHQKTLIIRHYFTKKSLTPDFEIQRSLLIYPNLF